MPRFCKDCRWVTWPWTTIRDWHGAVCAHPSISHPAAEPDLVAGGMRDVLPGTFCDTERRRSGRCGPDGKNWEPAE